MDSREELAELCATVGKEGGVACFQVGFDAFNKPETLLYGVHTGANL
jgi:hypothetical protein